MSSLQEDVKNLLKGLYSISPAFNGITQALFILPLKARVFWSMYPEFAENEEMLMDLFSIRYTDRGFLEVADGFGSHLLALYRVLFDMLMNVNKRRLLLKLANISENEFKEFDPLRAWLEVSLEYLSKVDKDALKILDVIVTKLSGKRPEEYVSWDEIKNTVTGIRSFEASLENLTRLFLIRYESSSWVYVRNCPLLLDFYADLRAKLKELLK
jgi:hypothetical protein